MYLCRMSCLESAATQRVMRIIVCEIGRGKFLSLAPRITIKYARKGIMMMQLQPSIELEHHDHKPPVPGRDRTCGVCLMPLFVGYSTNLPRDSELSILHFIRL